MRPQSVILQLAMCALFVCFPIIVHAQQPLPPDAITQLNNVIGSRVEAVMILGGDHGITGGLYTFTGGNVAYLDITKASGGGEVAGPSYLGIGDFKWAPVLQGSIGYSSAENDFATGYLHGNRSIYRISTVSFGGGVRIFVTDHLSFAPTFSGIYGHIENTFDAQNSVGTDFKASASGTYVDWELDTWSAVPSLDLQYEYLWRRTTFMLSTRYNFFHTESFNHSSPVVSVRGDSQTWEYKLDVDVPLGWQLFNRELHTGGFLALTELFGAASAGVDTHNFYTLNGRVVLAMPSNKWHLFWIGLGVSPYWSDSFRGLSAGIDIRLEF